MNRPVLVPAWWILAWYGGAFLLACGAGWLGTLYHARREARRVVAGEVALLEQWYAQPAGRPGQ